MLVLEIEHYRHEREKGIFGICKDNIVRVEHDGLAEAVREIKEGL